MTCQHTSIRALYDVLSELTAAVGHPGAEIDIVCGYRTPSTNEALRARTTGVAKNSLHIQAEAIDLRMPGVDTLTLRRAALGLARGGVGYYPHSDFIHVDTGRVRQWCFDCSPGVAAGDYRLEAAALHINLSLCSILWRPVAIAASDLSGT